MKKPAVTRKATTQNPAIIMAQPTSPKPKSTLLSQDETALFLGVSKNSLEKWRSERRGPVYVKVGRLVRYRLSDLEAYLTNREVQPYQSPEP
jgi:predicted DNA-binding transcriptional regulator AlpA